MGGVIRVGGCADARIGEQPGRHRAKTGPEHFHGATVAIVMKIPVGPAAGSCIGLEPSLRQSDRD